MFKRILILDLILAGVLVAGGANFRDRWVVYDSTHSPGFIQPKPETLPALPNSASTVQAPAADWTDIPSKNVFSFDRSDITLVAPEEAPPKPAGPKPILFGIVSLGSERMAMLATGQPGNRSYRPMKVGEVIDGWKVAEIQDKAVAIEFNQMRETIIMNDPTAQVARDHTRSIVPGIAAPAYVAPAPAKSQPAAPAATAPTAVPAPGAKKTRVVETPFGPKVIEEP